MGRTNAKKQETRMARLKALPTAQRLLKSASIKKKEGRVLDAAEKHALKMSSDHGEILRLWEKLRSLENGSKSTAENADPEATAAVATDRKIAYEHKYPMVEKLLHLIEPKFSIHVRTPKVSRVLQSMIKYGSPEQVGKIMKWVSKDFAAYCIDAYAHFVVSALIRHVPHDVFKILLTHLIPSVQQLVSHKFGLEVIHAAYSGRWCTALDCNLLLLSVFRDKMVVMKQWKGYPMLEEVIQCNPPLQKRLLTRLFDLVDKLVSQKSAIGYPFVQRLAHAFVRYGTRDEVTELGATLRPHLAAIAMTREGAPLASLVFALTEPLKRKDILRIFSEQLGELSTGKYSAPVIARLFDLLYDPQLLHKYVLKDFSAHLDQVISSPYGYLILIHLLTPHYHRKEKLLLPNWHLHNLFSLENKEWNHHTWLTPDYAQEVIEFCSKPALSSHLAALPSIAKSFFKLLDTDLPRLNRHHVGIIAREMRTVVDAEPLYQAALQLTPEQLAVLESVSPAKTQRLTREGAKEVRKQLTLQPELPSPKSRKTRRTTASASDEKGSKPLRHARTQSGELFKSEAKRNLSSGRKEKIK